MKWSLLDEKDNQVIKLLQESRQDFGFDASNVKAKLMMAVKSRPARNAEAPFRFGRHHFFPKYMAGLMVSILLVAGTAGLAAASNKARPGEALYKVQTFQNNLVLSLPLADTQKAQYRTDIVAQRLAELDSIQAPNTSPAQLQAEIQASNKSINDAVSNVTAIQSQAKQNHAKILSLVQQLNDLSTQHQQKMEALQSQITDEQVKAEIEQSLISIKANKERLHKAQLDSQD